MDLEVLEESLDLAAVRKAASCIRVVAEVLRSHRILAPRLGCLGSHAVHLVLGSAVAARTDSEAAGLVGSRREGKAEAAGGTAAEVGSVEDLAEAAAVLVEGALTVATVSNVRFEYSSIACAYAWLISEGRQQGVIRIMFALSARVNDLHPSNISS